MAATPSIIPSSMQMSMMFAPFSTCLPRDGDSILVLFP